MSSGKIDGLAKPADGTLLPSALLGNSIDISGNLSSVGFEDGEAGRRFEPAFGKSKLCIGLGEPFSAGDAKEGGIEVLPSFGSESRPEEEERGSSTGGEMILVELGKSVIAGIEIPGDRKLRVDDGLTEVMGTKEFVGMLGVRVGSGKLRDVSGKAGWLSGELPGSS